MKSLQECFEFYKDVYLDYLLGGVYGGLDRAQAQYKMMLATLMFVYPDFDDYKKEWDVEVRKAFCEIVKNEEGESNG